MAFRTSSIPTSRGFQSISMLGICILRIKEVFPVRPDWVLGFGVVIVDFSDPCFLGCVTYGVVSNAMCVTDAIKTVNDNSVGKSPINEFHNRGSLRSNHGIHILNHWCTPHFA